MVCVSVCLGAFLLFIFFEKRVGKGTYVATEDMLQARRGPVFEEG